MGQYKISFGNDTIPINQIDEEQRKKIIAFYQQAANDIKSQINTLQNSSKQNTSTKLQIYRLKELEKSIDYNLKEVTGKIKKEIENNMNKIVNMTVEEYYKYLGSQKIGFKTSYAHISNDIVNNILSGNLYKNQYGSDWNFSKRIWGDYNSAKGEVATIVNNGIASGKGIYEIAKDLEKYVTPNAKKPWDWGKVYPGCRKVIDYNAQRLARTMVGHAYQQSLVEMSKNNPFATGIEWRSALVERTCEICEQRHGKIYSPKDIPLDHPNGLCTYLMVFNKNTEQIIDELVDWVNGEENKELDKYATYITGKDFSKMSQIQKEQNMKISKEIENKLNSNIVNGKDISTTWTRREKEFKHEIEDIINAQGFDGLPTVVNSKDFDKLVKEANGGKGFIAQRVYSADTQEILDAYREQLYNGKWYVDCSVGGAQYGQGMYCAADYTGILSQGIKDEMKHYDEMYYHELSDSEVIKIATKKLEANINNIINSTKNSMDKEYHKIVDGFDFDTGMFKPEFRKEAMAFRDKNPDLMNNIVSNIMDAKNKINEEKHDFKFASKEKLAEKYNIQFMFIDPSYTETLTLTSNAKIIKYDDLVKMKQDEINANLKITKDDVIYTEYAKKIESMDYGAYAAMKGYDAINAEGHGQSGSYTVILNRTKLIIKEPEK